MADDASDLLDEEELPAEPAVATPSPVTSTAGNRPLVPSAPSDAQPPAPPKLVTLPRVWTNEKTGAQRTDQLTPSYWQNVDAENAAATAKYGAALNRFNARQMLAGQRAGVKDAKDVTESAFRSGRVQSYTDAEGNIQPVRDDQGNVQFRPGKGPVQYDESGHAVQTQWDTTGPKQVALDADAEIGPHPDRPNELYRQNKRSAWDYLGTLDEALQSPDKDVKSAAQDAKLALDKRLHSAVAEDLGQNINKAALAVQGKAQDVQAKAATLSQLQAESDQLAADPRLTETEGGFIGIGKRPTQTSEALQQKKADIDKQIQDLVSQGYSTDPKQQNALLKPEKDALAAAHAVRGAWNSASPKEAGDFDRLIQDRQDEVSAQGGDPASDPILQALEKRKAALGITPAKPAVDQQLEQLRKDPTFGPILQEHDAINADEAKANEQVNAVAAEYKKQLMPLRDQVTQAEARLNPIRQQVGGLRQQLERLVGMPGAIPVENQSVRNDEVSRRISQIQDPATRAKAQAILNVLEPAAAEFRQGEAAAQPLRDQHDQLLEQAQNDIQTRQEQIQQEIGARRLAVADKLTEASNAQEQQRWNVIRAHQAYLDAKSGDPSTRGYQVDNEGKLQFVPGHQAEGMAHAVRDGLMPKEVFDQNKKAAIEADAQVAQAHYDAQNPPGVGDRVKNFVSSIGSSFMSSVGELTKFFGNKVKSEMEPGLLQKVMSLGEPASVAQSRAENIAKAQHMADGMVKYGGTMQDWAQQNLVDPKLAEDWEAKVGRFIGGAFTPIVTALATGPGVFPLLYAQGYQGVKDDAERRIAAGQKIDQSKVERSAVEAGALNTALGIIFEGFGRGIGALIRKPVYTEGQQAIRAAILKAYQANGLRGVDAVNRVVQAASEAAGKPVSAEAAQAMLDSFEEVQKDIGTSLGKRILRAFGTMARDAAIGGGVQVGQNVIASQYDPKRNLMEGVGESAVGFGAMGLLGGAAREVGRAKLAARDRAFVAGNTPARPQLPAGGESAEATATAPAPAKPDITAVHNEINNLPSQDYDSPEQRTSTQHALRGLVKIAQGQSMDALTAEEKGAVMHPQTADGMPRVELVKGADGKKVPVITQGTLDRVEQVAPTVRAMLPESEEKQRQTILQPPAAAKESSKTAATETPTTAESSQTVPRGTPAAESPQFSVDVERPGGKVETVKVAATTAQEAHQQVASSIPAGKGMVREVVQTSAATPAATTNLADEAVRQISTEAGRKLEPAEEKAVRNLATRFAPAVARWQAAFSGIRVTARSYGSMGGALDRESRLHLSLPDIVKHARELGSTEAPDVLVRHEAIHAVTQELTRQGKIDPVGLYRSLPDEVKKYVEGVYEPGSTERNDHNDAHEFVRMMVEDKLSLDENGALKDADGATITEHLSPSFISKIRDMLTKLLAVFRDLANQLRKHGADEKVIAEAEKTRDLVIERLKEVDAAKRGASVRESETGPTRSVTEKASAARKPEQSGVAAPAEGTGRVGSDKGQPEGVGASGEVAAGEARAGTGTELNEGATDQGRDRVPTVSQGRSKVTQAQGAIGEKESSEIAAAGRALKQLQVRQPAAKLAEAVAAARNAKIPVTADNLVRYALSGRFDEPRPEPAITEPAPEVSTTGSAAGAEVEPIAGEQSGAEGSVPAGTVPVERAGEPDRGVSTEPSGERRVLGDSIELAGEKIPLAGEWKTKNPRGSEVFSGKWALVPLKSLKINTQLGEAQDRIDREKTGAAQRLEIINNLTADNVDLAWGASPTLNDGAPIITDTGSVEVGNNRTMAIRDMFANHPEKASIYEKFAREQAVKVGLDAKLFAGEPIALVRVASPERGGLTQSQFVKASNTAGTEQRSVAETAMADRQLFASPDLANTLNPNDDGSFNREFLTAFYNAVGAPKDLRFEDGTPDDGKIERRAQAALLAHLLGSQPGVDRVLSSLIDNINTPGVRQVVSGLSKAGPALVAAETINPSLSITPNLGRALTSLLDYRRAKDAGEVRNVADYQSQGQLFAAKGTKADPLDARLLELLAEARSVKQVSDPLLRYAKAVQDYGDPKQQRFFGDEEPPSAAAVLAAQSLSDDRDMLWNVAENAKSQRSAPELQRDITSAGKDAKYWANIYRKLFPLEKEGKLTADQRTMFEQAEAALGQKLMFGDEVKGQQSLQQFKAKWSEGPIQGGEVQSQQGLFDTKGAVGRIPEGEDQGTLFAQRTREIQGQLNLFDRLSEPEQKQAVAVADKIMSPVATEQEPSGQKVPDLTASPEFSLGDVDSTPAPTTSVGRASNSVIRDFGEKIGGARKDLAVATGPKGEAKAADNRPAWLKKYHVFEDANKPRVWAIGLDDGGLATRQTFSSKEEAEKMVPLLEVARNHSVRSEGGTPETFSIRRELGPRKFPTVKGGFASREEAMRYMAEHSEDVINHKFAFPDKPWLDRIERTGPEVRKGDITPEAFQNVFGFRGGEFGNWNMGSDGQAALNHAYDALLDLAHVLGIEPKALSLNGDLAIAFGARGHGLQGARAHYEPDYAVINLTKIKGAGSAAHEWFHAFDHYLARQDTKASSEKTDAGTFKVSGNKSGNYVSHGFGYKSKVRDELRAAFKNVMDAMVRKNVTGEIDKTLAEKNQARMSEHIRDTIKDIRRSMTDSYQYSRKGKPPTEDQLKRFDAIAEKITAGDVGERTFISSGRGPLSGRSSYQAIEDLNEVYKDALGRSFATNADHSLGKQLYWQINSMRDAQERLAKASDGVTEVKSRPTDYFRESRNIDNFRATDYWSTPHEMGARSFEAFVHDKLAAENRRSDYLVHGVENKYYAALGLKPYPEGEERAALDAAWQKVFDIIEQQPTEKGIALRSQSVAQTPAERFKEMLPVALNVAKNYSNIPGVDQPDVDQHARMALVRASREFDPAKGASLETFTRTVVGNELKSLYGKMRRGPAGRETTSLDEALPDSELTPKDLITAPDDTVSTVQRSEGVKVLTDAINELPARMRDAMLGILSGDSTLEEIGEGLGGISRQAVGRLATEAMRRLRGKLGEKGISSTDDLLRAQKLVYEGANDKEYSKSSTQVTLSEDEAKPFVDFAKSIPQSQLYVDPDDPTFGRETEPHVTALYGITEASPKTAANVVLQNAPSKITATVGKLSIFKTDKYDVVKADITSPDLVALNKKLRDSVPYETDFPDYHPHLTIAYLKHGQGEKYVGDSRFEGKTLTFSKLDFRGKDGRMYAVDLSRGDKSGLLLNAVENQLKAQATEDPVDALMTMLRDDPLDILRGLAQDEPKGSQTIGRPDLALGNAGPEMRAVHERHTDTATAQTIEQWDTEGAQLLRDTPDFGAHILKRWADGLPLSPPEVRAAQRWIINRQGQPKSGVEQENYDAAAYAYTKIGEKTARELAARRDPFQTPVERARDFLAKALSSFLPEENARVDSLTDQQAKVKEVERIVAERRAKIDASLKSIFGKGITLDDILTGETELRLKGAPIVENIVSGFDEAGKKAFKLIQGGELSFDAIAKRTGLTPAQVEAVRDRFVESFRAKHFAKFKAGLKADAVDAQGTLLAQDTVLRAQAVTDAAAEAEFQRALKMMGVVPKSDQGTMKVVKRRTPKRRLFVPPPRAGAPVEPPTSSELPYPPETSAVAGEAAAVPTGRVLGQIGLPLEQEIMTRKGLDLGSPVDVARLMRVSQAATNRNLFDMAFEFGISSLLSNPTTHFAYKMSVLGHSGFEHTIRRGVEALLNLAVQDPKSATFGEFKYLRNALLPAFSKAWQIGVEQWASETDMFTKEFLASSDEMWRMPGDWMASGGPAIPGRLGRNIRMPLRALYFIDGFNKTLNSMIMVAPHAYRIARSEGLSGDKLEKRVNELVATPGSEAWHRASEQAEYLTARAPILTRAQQAEKEPNMVRRITGSQIPFEGPLDALVSGVGGVRKESYLLSTVVPFVNIPYNLLKMGAGVSVAPIWTPAKVFLAAGVTAANTRPNFRGSKRYDPNEGFFKVKDGKHFFDNYERARFVRDVATAMIATSVLGLLWHAVAGDGDDDKKSFLITGSEAMGGDEKKRGLRELTRRAYGGPFVMRFGGRDGWSINFGKYEPAATVLGTLADTIIHAKRVLRGQEKMRDAVDGIGNFIGSQIEEKSFLRGIGNIMQMINGEKSLSDVSTQMALSWFVPGLIRSPLRNLDEYQRDTRGASFLQLLTGNLPKKIDVYGNEVKKTGNAFTRMFTLPSDQPYRHLENADRLLLNWNNAHPSEAWAPAAPTSVYRDAFGKSVQMTAQQREKFLHATGANFENKVRALGLTNYNIEHPTSEDVKRIQDAHREATDQTKREMFPSRVNVVKQWK